MNKYDSIINLPHFESRNHKRMSIESRSAQFAPFSALAGFYDEINYSNREKDIKKELLDDEKERINSKLQLLEKGKEYSICYYSDMDEKYINEKITIKKIDLHKGIIKTINNKISIDNIIDIVV